MLTPLLIILSSYFLFLLILIIGWSKMKASKNSSPTTVQRISVLVAVRNESTNIDTLLHSLLAQDYSNYEIILIDDHSSDSTAEVIANFVRKNPSTDRIISLKNAGTGKKAALTIGVIHSTGDIIVTTDADCQMGNGWLKNISASFNDKVQMVTGGVRIKQDGAFFADLQSIEFASLIGSSASTLALGFPTMCNGANLSFRKSAFIEVGGYQENMHVPSGDDEFLMRKIAEHYPGSIRFQNNPETVVTTSASPTAWEFIQQRIRWAGKWRHNTSVTTVLVAFYVILIQASLIATFILLPTNDFQTLGSMLLIRMVLEAWFLYRVSRFLNFRWNIFAFLALQFLYPWYVILVGMTSGFMPYSWKERRWRQSLS